MKPWMLALSILLVSTVEARARVKRQSTFRVISDGQEFPCEGPQMTQYEAMGIPKIELNDEQKLELYRQLGGEFLSSFMGISGQPNKPYKERGVTMSPWRIGKKINKKITGYEAVGLKPLEPMSDEPEDSAKSTPSSAYEYCNNRTDPTMDPQYLLMCTSCARSINMGQDVWPTEFYETDCIHGQQNCLFHQGAAYGRCQQSKMWASVLRKKTGQCVIALANGSSVVTEEWYLENVQINVGCECAVDKDSEFR